MEWISPVVSGIGAVLSLLAVFIVAKMHVQGEHTKWLREERVRSAIDLKMAVSRVRVTYSRPAAGRPSPSRTLDQSSPNSSFDFVEVNAAMARLDIVGSSRTVLQVATLRDKLREFVRASTENEADWRERRDAVDATVNSIVQSVRKDVS
ncbi:hypothetical protein [Streptomyces aurantiacus]|uniref:hypothetical protein n=1 Tax=Streptomyces aurantiacus TaxID=47760 RepID=UPI0006E3E8DF|nr:hypothetical protein [Streptomyces aurantiacus]